MTTVKFIDLVVKKELEMDGMLPIFDVCEAVWPEGVTPAMIADAEDARRVESKMELVRKSYKRLDFEFGGEVTHMYVCLDDAIGVDKVLGKIVDARVDTFERKLYNEISASVDTLKQRVVELGQQHAAMKTKIEFYEGMLTVRCVMYCLKLWREVIGWSSRLVQRLGIS